MNQPGSRRTVGVALLTSAGLMLVLAIVILSGTIPAAADARPILSGALALAAVVDAVVGLRMVQQG